MKKIISILLVLVIALSITACDTSGKNENTNTNTAETLPLDTEALKANWKEGELIFANENSVKLPCTPTEMVEASGLVVNNSNSIVGLTLAPDETKTISLSNSDTKIEIICKNTTDEEINIMDSTIVNCNFTNIKSGNRKIKFAGTLTAGVTRADVEAALEIPKDATSEDAVYFYSGRNSSNKKVELRIGFNSDDIVNSVAFEIDA